MAEVLVPSTTQNGHIAHLQSGPADYHHQTMSTSNQRQSRILDMPRSHFNNNAAVTGYRGTAAAPVSTYAFKSTPQLRSVSTPALATPQTATETANGAPRQRYPANPSVSTTSSTSSDPSSISQHHLFNKEDALLFTNFSVPPFHVEQDPNGHEVQVARPENVVNGTPSPPRPAPDRYRRPMNRAVSDHSTIRSQQSEDSIRTVGAATAAPVYQNAQSVAVGTQNNAGQDVRQASAGQTEVQYASNGKQSPTSELPKRYRRRNESSTSIQTTAVAPATSNTTNSTQVSQMLQDGRPSSPSGYRPPSASSTTRSFSSADAIRRVNNPSPLSRPATTQSENRPFSSSSSQISQSPAIAAMSAIKEKDSGKTMKSRLRRAFSFGSATELNRAGVNQASAADRARARQQQFSSELDDEQAAIAQKQEKSGLGNGIYGNKTSTFTGSMDNLSISSTASSASVMLRKMGQGVKKGGRSLKGLFRPKSVIGVPSADESLASVGQVSMVTVEAEREQVNVNVNPRDQPGGGTGYPRLERNSVDAEARVLPQPAKLDISAALANPARDAQSSDSDFGQFRSASAPPMKKGILKRAYTASPIASPGFMTADGAADIRPPVFAGGLNRSSSPAPSTGSNSSRRHRRTDSSAVDSDDYFGNLPRVAGDRSYRSLPGTPRERLRRNISFSPRIQFHDVWSATEYDRRGDIATCNRLTPMLAQQIKEELNTFKMEMEVHELSKVHTHFF